MTTNNDEYNQSDMPEKIPDFIMVKILRQEIGKLKSYIDELESMKNVNLYKAHKETFQNLKKKNKDLKGMVNKLLVENMSLRAKVQELEQKIKS